MRNSSIHEDSKTTGTGELKAVAKEAWDLGAHAMHAAGNWLDNMRTSKMKDRNQESGHQQANNQGGYGQGAGPHYNDMRGRDQDYRRAGQDFSQSDESGYASRSGGGYGQRHAPWREQGLGRDDYPYDEPSSRGEARRGGYGMDEAERSYGEFRQHGDRDDGYWQGQRGAYGSGNDPVRRFDMGDARGSSGYRSYGQGGGYQQSGRGHQQGYQPASYGQSGPDYGQRDASYRQTTEPGFGSAGEYRQFGSGDGGGGGYQRSGSQRYDQGGARQYDGGREGAYAYGSQSRSVDQGQSPQRGYGSRRGLGPRSYTRSDDRIREDVNERLMDDDHVDASEITVQVKDGAVILSGTVGERWEKHRAEDIAGACSGVRDVQNTIRLASGSSSSSASSSSSRSEGRDAESSTGSAGSSSTKAT